MMGMNQKRIAAHVSGLEQYMPIETACGLIANYIEAQAAKMSALEAQLSGEQESREQWSKEALERSDRAAKLSERVAELASQSLLLEGEIYELRSELTASTERVRQMEQALEKIANDKWAMTTDMKGYDCSIAEVARGALSRQDEKPTCWHRRNITTDAGTSCQDCGEVTTPAPTAQACEHKNLGRAWCPDCQEWHPGSSATQDLTQRWHHNSEPCGNRPLTDPVHWDWTKVTCPECLVTQEGQPK